MVLTPKLWIKRSEDYFDLYQVAPSISIRVTTMHFSGALALWLQSVEECLRSMAWLEFCSILLGRFGHDQHEILVRRFLTVK